MTSVDVDVTGIAAGGDGVAHLPDGRVVFVRGAIPGDRARVTLAEDRARFARGDATEVLVAGPGRVEAPCPLVAAGCGGCGWQHVEPARQRDLKASIVADALVRIGRIDPSLVPEVDPGPQLAPTRYRTTVRAAVADGRAGLRRARGHEVVDVSGEGCLVAHPSVDEVLRLGRFPGSDEVVVRAGVASGQRLVVLHGSTTAPAAAVPDDVEVVTDAELRAGRRAWIHEDVAGRRWRVSARSFFQARPDGAAALCDAVADGASEGVGTGGARITDLYGGVGLLAGAVADRIGPAASVRVVEANRAAVADARVNLADIADARVVRADVRRWHPGPTDVLVADPSRHGLGADVVAKIAATEARSVVLVSCDPGSLGRDAGDLGGAGYLLGSVRLIDLFPHTPHVEVVTTWRRAV